MNNNFEWLFKWFHQQCDGDWEHGRGIQIGTLSNPGWYIKIDLQETYLEDKYFDKCFVERSQDDWIFCIKQNGYFEGDCGLYNLPEILQIFRSWVESNAGV